jgi:hypothetical protein
MNCFAVCPARCEHSGLRPFVLDWLADPNSGGGQMRGLLEFLEDPHEPDSRYSYGGPMMMANIAPRAVPDDANDEVLLFYASWRTISKLTDLEQTPGTSTDSSR